MGTMSGVKAVFGLSGSGVPTGINVSGTQRLGVSQSDAVFTTAPNIFYSVTITATATTDVATLNLASGVIVQTTGTPDVTRRGSEIDNLAGVDFEGVDLPTSIKNYGVLFQGEEGNTGWTTITPTNAYLPTFLISSGNRLLWNSDVGESSPGNVALAFAVIGDSVTITVAGGTS